MPPKAALEAKQRVEEFYKTQDISGSESPPVKPENDTENNNQDLEIHVAEPLKIETEPPAKNPGEDIQKQYDELKTKYDAEVQSLRAKIDSLLESNKNLQELLVELSKPKEEGQTDDGGGQAVVEPQPTFKKFDLDDFDDYGDEIKSMAETINSLIDSNEALKSENTSLKDQITTSQTRFNQVEETVAESNSSKFWAGLSNAIPNWEEYNKQQWWLNWLGQPDEMSGVIRQKLLEQSIADLDLNRTVNIFKLAMKDNGIKENGKRTTQGDLNDQIVPDHSVGSEQVGNDQFVPVTLEELNQAKHDKRLGKMSMDKFQDIANRFLKTQKMQAAQAG